MSATESTYKEEINAKQNMCLKNGRLFWLLSEVSTAEGEAIAFSRTESSCREDRWVLPLRLCPTSEGVYGCTQLRIRLFSVTLV